MSGEALRVAWFRFRGTLGRRWSGYLSIALLVGLVGGVAMGAVAAARRTQSSFPELAARTDASGLYFVDSVYNPADGLDAGYFPGLVRAIAKLPHVKRVESEVEPNMVPLLANGAPNMAAVGIGSSGSVDGLFFDQDRVIVTHGRMADPRLDEFIMDSATARQLGMRLGEDVTFAVQTNAQSQLPPAKALKVLPRDRRVTAKLVGVGVVQVQDLVQDDVDANGSGLVLFTPAVTDPLLACCTNASFSAVQLYGGDRYDLEVENEVAQALPKGVPRDFVLGSVVEAKAERTIRPESIALGVFGGIAALAALVIAGQVIGRRLRSNSDDLAVLRALGASPAMTALDGLVGVLGAVLAGAVLAVLVAVGVSPLAPLGPARPYLPIGVGFDWTVLGSGVMVLVGGLSAVAVVGAYRGSPQRSSSRRRQWFNRRSAAAQAAASAGLPAPVVAGLRFALEPGAGRHTVPVRSAILGAAVAVVVVTATITFGASLRTLVSHPALYGWNWNYELNGGGGLGDLPAKPTAALLDKDPYVTAWSGVYFSTLSIDGQDVAVMGVSPKASVAPPLLSGHAVDAPDQVVLGAATLAELHKRVGQTVEVRAADSAPTELHIVGTATLPAIGVGGSTHLEMGSGALLPYQLVPPGQRDLFEVAPGPNAVLIRTKPGADQAAVVKSLQTIIFKLQAQFNGAAVQGVQRPAEVIGYSNLGATPGLLGGALAAGAVVALGLTLIASVRRRRGDLALLKTLGFTNGQLAATIVWQSTVAVAIGTVVGVPLGIALGRHLWDLFAREINAVPDPSVPVVSVVLVAIGALVLANLVAAVPGRIAARTQTALLLQTE
jgi:hypothetical protein